MNKDIDDVWLAILLPQKKIRFCLHNDRRIWHPRRQLSTNAEQIYSSRALAMNTKSRIMHPWNFTTPARDHLSTTAIQYPLSPRQQRLGIQKLFLHIELRWVYSIHIMCCDERSSRSPREYYYIESNQRYISQALLMEWIFTIQQQIQRPNAFRTTRLKTAFDKTNITASRTTRLSKIESHLWWSDPDPYGMRIALNLRQHLRNDLKLRQLKIHLR